MKTIICPPIYNEDYQEFNEDAYFASFFKASKLSAPMMDIAEKIVSELETGSGCVVLKNSYSGHNLNREKSVLINVCRHIGWPVSQTPNPNFLEEITFKPSSNILSTSRGYRSRASIPLHTDRCDLNVLLCFAQAGNGGTTRIVNSVKLYDKIKENIPTSKHNIIDSYFPFSRHGETTEREKAFYLSKIFHSASSTSKFVAHYIRCFIENDNVKKDYPLNGPMIELLDAIDQHAKCTDVGFNLTLSKGDILFLNSHTTLHSREAYQDQKNERLLLRMWLSHPFSRPLPDDFSHAFKNIAPGSYRGGIWDNDKVRIFYQTQFLHAQHEDQLLHAQHRK